MSGVANTKLVVPAEVVDPERVVNNGPPQVLDVTRTVTAAPSRGPEAEAADTVRGTVNSRPVFFAAASVMETVMLLSPVTETGAVADTDPDVAVSVKDAGVVPARKTVRAPVGGVSEPSPAEAVHVGLTASGLPYASKPKAVKTWVPPSGTLVDAGEIAILAKGPGPTVSVWDADVHPVAEALSVDVPAPVLSR